MRVVKKVESYLFAGIFVFSLLLFLAHTAYTKTAIFADGRYYYSITRSAVRDFDINFKNEFQFFGIEMETNKYGFPENFYPPGVSFLWIPSFWLADGFTQLLQTLVIKIDNSGFGIIHQVFVSAGNIFLGVLGLYILHNLLTTYFNKKLATLATLSLFTTTNLLFYIAIEPINSHAASFFISCLFVFALLKDKNSLLLGFLSGIAGITRTQDLLLITLPGLKYLKERKIINLAYLFLGLIIGFLPQLFLWRVFYDTFWKSPYLKFGFNALAPQIIHVLFNTQNGLFTITPSIAFALIGLFILRPRSPIIFLYSVFYFFIQIYIISSWSGFAQGGSFSIRMAITTYPLLAFGLAQIIEKLYQKFVSLGSYLTIFFFSFLNFALIFRYLLSY